MDASNIVYLPDRIDKWHKLTLVFKASSQEAEDSLFDLDRFREIIGMAICDALNKDGIISGFLGMQPMSSEELEEINFEID